MKNEYEVRGDVTAIILRSPKYGVMETLISTSKLNRAGDFPNLWQARYSNITGSFYVQGKMSTSSNKGKMVSLHRWVMNAPAGVVVDHINHDTLNNTDTNLREITHAENLQNRRGAMKNSKSGVRGVSWSKKSRKWKARTTIDNNEIYLGLFESIEDAEKAVKEARAKYMPYSQEALAN